ncbi:T9SS type A sorting domain-containing protein [Phnomibacter sp. MR]|uniref:T9SS type A sorting domain-containing protein n=1 Tax=Phnomibacter sp. MR TaxID=3042318 RepID=UPI003A8115EC
MKEHVLLNKALCILMLCLLSNLNAFAQPGKNGAATITAAGTTVNTYTNVTADIAAASTSITVANSALAGGAFGATPLATGDYILIIQMQGASIDATNTAAYGSITALNSAGLYEFACVSAVPDANTITLAAPTQNTYTATGKVQVVRIPRYTTLTVNAGASIVATAWNGTTGGVVAIETTGAVILNGTPSINVNGLGFRGGVLDNASAASSSAAITTYRSTLNTDGAEKGESIAGFQAEYDALNGRFGRGAPANGGGGGNTHNAGGGGGSNGNNGIAYTGNGNPSTSTASWANAWNLESAGFATSASSGGGRGGYTYGISNQDALTIAPGATAWGGNRRQNVGGFGGRPLLAFGSRLYLGGGGGAGDTNGNAGGAGGNGGGLVFLIAGGNVTGAGTIVANGNAGANTTGRHNDAPGGGGGGGTVVIYNRAGNVANTISIQANGGAGGNQLITSAESEGPGGGGGGGYIGITSGTPARTVAGGANGTTTSTSVTEFTPNGATVGAGGSLLTYTPVGSLFIPVSGTVFNDANGQTDALVNGTGTNLSSALYISAVQSSVVVATAPVQANGTYSFASLAPGTYNFVLHNNASGQATAVLPAGVVNTAEGSTAAGDGTINGVVISTSSCAALTNLNYGINRLPVANNYNTSGWSLPPGNSLENVPSSAFSGSDAEDGTYANNLNGRTVTLNPAVGGTLFYFDGSLFVPITSTTVISNFNNDNVYINPTASVGPTTVGFSFLVRDNAGFDNVVPAQVNMSFSVLLPATGLSLSGSYANGKVKLRWQTLTEQQTRSFAVEMSYDGVLFQQAGLVAAAGNSNALRKYQFDTDKPAGQKWYFRIRLTDADGSVSYSNIISLTASATASAKVGMLPNPAREYVWVSGLAKAKEISVLAMNGMRLKRIAVTAENMQVDVSALATGVYILQVAFADGSKEVVKLYKQ